MKQKLKIIKIGGNVINNKEALSSFLADFSTIKEAKILVHGGGKRATEILAELGLKPKMVNGRRVTDKDTLEIVTMVYAGLLNKNITAQLQQNNCNAIGLSGADANSILAHKRIVKDVDYGFVGDVDAVNSEMIKVFVENNLTPVFCAITHDKIGQLLNTNADTIAAELAKGMSKYFEVELIYCFEKLGVLANVDDDATLIEKIDFISLSFLKKANIISDGMLPKIDNCFDALQNGVSKVIIGKPKVIIDENLKHTTLTL
ncbi:MAG: acetylglutamate kinase [Flavobacteriaceae bacterium]|nr:acetylglutamate kinase [Flavobacteriaceae bacterium]